MPRAVDRSVPKCGYLRELARIARDWFGGEFVDGLRVDVDLVLQPMVLLPKAIVRCFSSFRASIELLERSWHLVLRLCTSGE